MQFKIDNASEKAVYQQIVDQVRRQVALGRIAAADKLPTVRELASELVINPNTIAKAYKQLEQEGIITTRPGVGTFIADSTSTLSLNVKKKILQEKLEDIFVDAVHMQFDKKMLKELFEQTADKFESGRIKGQK